MKVLLINKFLYPKGGDAIVTFNTGKLLKEKGHKVAYWGMRHEKNLEFKYEVFFVDKVDYKTSGFKTSISFVLKILYSLEAKNKIKRLLSHESFDIIHLHNFAHQISPSILHVFKKRNIPVVMTSHDYKLVCPSYSMLVDGVPCERCKNSKYYWCFVKKCTKNSYLKSFINVVEMYLHHKILHIYDDIDIFISPSMFLKEKLKEMGFKHKIEYLPNCIYPGEFIPKYENNGKSICYFGRLSHEKGLVTLIKAMKGLDDVELKIIGDGQIKEKLKHYIEDHGVKNIRFLGYKTGNDLDNEIKNSSAVVIPSEWYENNPRTVLEAFALGKPVIGARIGGIPELVKDADTGYTFEAGNAGDLREKIMDLISSPEKIVQMGKNARKFVEEKFNAEKHYKELMRLYQLAIEKNKGNLK
ncbi:MAG: glycosyltransferase family 4 protein [bacterium]